MAAPLTGLVLRPSPGLSDVPEMLRILTAGNEADGVDERESEAGLANWLTHPSPGFNPADDVVAEVDGEAVGYGWTFWVDATDGGRDYITRGYVHPAWRRRGVGTAILERNEARLRAMAASHDTDRPQRLGSFADDSRRAPRESLLSLLRGEYHRHAKLEPPVMAGGVGDVQPVGALGRVARIARSRPVGDRVRRQQRIAGLDGQQRGHCAE